MLKFVFWLLLGVNAVLFAMGRGYLGSAGADDHEPERMKNQLNVDKMSLRITASAPAAPAEAIAAIPEAKAEAKTAAKAEAVKPVAKPREALLCAEIGNFPAADARRFESKLTPLDLGERKSRRSVQGQDISSYIVYIPSLGSKEAADKKVIELKELGVTNYFIMSEDSPMRFGISLGVFKLETGAQTLLATLLKQGVHSARVSPRYGNSKQVAFQFRDIDSATKKRLEQIRAEFPEQEMRACK